MPLDDIRLPPLPIDVSTAHAVERRMTEVESELSAEEDPLRRAFFIGQRQVLDEIRVHIGWRRRTMRQRVRAAWRLGE